MLWLYLSLPEGGDYPTGRGSQLFPSVPYTLHVIQFTPPKADTNLVGLWGCIHLLGGDSSIRWEELHVHSSRIPRPWPPSVQPCDPGLEAPPPPYHLNAELDAGDDL